MVSRMETHCSASKMAALLLLTLLQSLLHHTTASSRPAVNITQIPSNPQIALGVNESVFLQIYIEGEVHDVRSMVSFGGAPQDSCTKTRNLESKLLEENLLIVCDQAHWVSPGMHSQKYEVRITNGEAARQVNQVTVRLNAFRFEGGEVPQIWSAEFQVTMLKHVAMATEETSTAVPTEEGTTTLTDDRMTTPIEEDTTTLTDDRTTTPTEESTTTPGTTTSTEESATTLFNLDTTPSVETNSQTTMTETDDISTTSGTLPETTPTKSIQQNIADFLTDSKQNQITMALGLTAVFVIVTEAVVIVCLIKYRQRRTRKLYPAQSTEMPESIDSKYYEGGD